MSDSAGGYRRHSETSTGTGNVGRIAGLGTALVALNVLLMLALSYTPVVSVGRALFSSFFLGVAAFAVSVGGGYWLADRGIRRGTTSLAVAGVALTQVGYGLFGATALSFASPALRAPALGISAVVTGLITALVTVVVYRTDRSFVGWSRYAGGLFIGGIAVGALGVFVAPVLVVVAGLLFFLGFVVDLVYEIWAIREGRYGTLRSALGVYIAVMGVFVHVLQWVLRLLAVLDQ
ncbi:hypothetical protein [Halomarina litorea]|uniref:hypothetical protein n=1 Tax=Halomarina litorea TaxID=2961595 RepID=UPI0020C27D96|nr:hypothetical protein [Halomarina sp. BCD28]